jgi:hypothetical protein
MNWTRCCWLNSIEMSAGIGFHAWVTACGAS